MLAEFQKTLMNEVFLFQNYHTRYEVSPRYGVKSHIRYSIILFYASIGFVTFSDVLRMF